VIGKSSLLCACCVLLGWALVGCSERQDTPKAPAPELVLQAIPAANPAQYERIHDMKSWRNPYLIVRADKVALFDAADNAEILLKPEELLPTLAALPSSNWPYGRVVAATEDRPRGSEQEAVEVRRIKGIVGGMLQGAQIAIKWVPSA